MALELYMVGVIVENMARAVEFYRRLGLLHERRTAFRGVVRTRSNGSLGLRRSVPDWFGTDTVVVRATGPRAETCRVSAALR